MQMHCQDCGWVGCCTELLSGEDDGHGPRGICPNCGADEEEFATANEREVAAWQAYQRPAEHLIIYRE